ncbi:VanZ family protein [Aneurinibacillus tyrosinisolvens]|uniref:VanZ family protein n=1 Tax=Aneurinibacillus tyrosinisolvens TaxID=1443435 RepID=UPI00063F5A54|nr:VanZ family protein [Aneurinibacillus tyrosinisolvens]
MNLIFQRYPKQIKYIITCIWALILGVFTSVNRLDTILFDHTLKFQWISTPDFYDLFKFSDINLIHSYWITVKLGHLIGFAFLEWLIYFSSKDHRKAIIFTVLFAITTEILQLFLARDGRLYDIIIDSTGGILSYYVKGLYNNLVNDRKTNHKLI